MLLIDFVDRQAARVVRGFGVIGDAEILIPALARRLRHHLQRIDAVRQIGMRMQDAAEIAVGDERGSSPSIARSISSRPSRSSGAMKGRPSAA